jgi:glycerol-3-phosphate acyltransferase PlsY
MVVFAMLLLIVFRHRANIRRLMAGNENKFSLKKNG